jgi:hypothetical protein
VEAQRAESGVSRAAAAVSHAKLSHGINNMYPEDVPIRQDTTICFGHIYNIPNRTIFATYIFAPKPSVKPHTVASTSIRLCAPLRNYSVNTYI